MDNRWHCIRIVAGSASRFHNDSVRSLLSGLGSLRNPFVIVLTLPLAVVGVTVALAITDRALGLAAMMGLLLLRGIVVTNSHCAHPPLSSSSGRGASACTTPLSSGARVWLRTILMTAITTSFALLPLAVQTEAGGLISAELATVAIGGLTSSTALTLLVLPHRLSALQREHPEPDWPNRPPGAVYGIRKAPRQSQAVRAGPPPPSPVGPSASWNASATESPSKLPEHPFSEK